MRWRMVLLMVPLVSAACSAAAEQKAELDPAELARVLEDLAVALVGVPHSQALKDSIGRQLPARLAAAKKHGVHEVGVAAVDPDGKRKGILSYDIKFGYVRTAAIDAELRRLGPIRVTEQEALATARKIIAAARWPTDLNKCSLFISRPSGKPDPNHVAPMWNFNFREMRDGLPTTNMAAVGINAHTSRLVSYWAAWEPLDEVNTTPDITRQRAIEIALASAPKSPDRRLCDPDARLWVRNMDGKTRLVWQVITSEQRRTKDGRWQHVPGGGMFFWVDAHTGELLHLKP